MINITSLQLKFLFIKIPERKQVTHWEKTLMIPTSVKNLDPRYAKSFTEKNSNYPTGKWVKNRHFTEMEL